MSERNVAGSDGTRWQYHSRSDQHSRVACWGLVFDLLLESAWLRRQVGARKVAFGINHEMHDFAQNRKKNLDLVLCTPRDHGAFTPMTLRALGSHAFIRLTEEEQNKFDALPVLQLAPVGRVLAALEAKACMTAHIKALPRLYDELNSSQQTIRGNSESAVAAGLVIVNVADEFVSPTNRSQVAKHKQPQDAQRAVEKVQELRRRARVADDGFDAIGIVALSCRNDGSPVTLSFDPPAPAANDQLNYSQLVHRVAATLESRFGAL
jgi:hypothetical protein